MSHSLNKFVFNFYLFVTFNLNKILNVHVWGFAGNCIYSYNKIAFSERKKNGELYIIPPWNKVALDMQTLRNKLTEIET